jgi:hypothetical protein
MDRKDVPGDPVWLGTDLIQVAIATTFGPRIVWCSRPDEANLFAELADLSLDAGEGKRYMLRGGHRLWVGPEMRELTYQTDDERVAVVHEEGAVTVTSHADEFGLVKTMKVSLVPDEPSVVIDHTIRATAGTTLDIAAWAITQLRPGGVALIPLGLPGGAFSDVQASHQIVMWPYTDLNDPAITLGRSEVTVGTDVAANTKIGTPLLRGWLAYAIDDVVFVKRASVDGERFVDLGATGQVYSSPDFIELETLGPITPVANRAAIHHRETWHIYDRPDGSVMDLGAALALDGALS